MASVSPLQQLRDQRHRSWLTALHQQLGEALASEQADPSLWAIYLFGSRARGDWDGFSDTDLLVVGSTSLLLIGWLIACVPPALVMTWWPWIRAAGLNLTLTPRPIGVAWLVMPAA